MIADTDKELLEILVDIFPNSKKNTLRKMLTEGRVEVDGKVIHKAKHIVVSGSKVVILEKKKAEEFSEKPKKNKKN